MAKLMVSIHDQSFQLLSLEAKTRGITVQELIRAVIVPDWFRNSEFGRATRANSDLLIAPRLKSETEVPLFNRTRP
ncbi:hypothetical protein J2P12_04020 [Candidatus Bathyarchaeota archaeon]|nr:hypothetical protein [Candidatus Bathyarchaeota archaeon]